MTKPITMIEIFSGIGAQERAARQLPIPFEVVGTMDVDKDAVLSYASMRWDLEKEMETYNFPSKEQMVLELQAKNLGFDFSKNKHTITAKTSIKKVKQYYIADKLSKNLGDVSLQKELPYVDIIVHSSPCQDYSVAGKGAGGDEGSGTRSSLMFESLRLIETSRPQFVLWENVAAVLSDKHIHNFIKYLERMSELGYENTFDLLNAKNFGVPQNRLRIFCASRKIESTDNKIGNMDDMPQSSNKQVENIIKKIRKNPNIKMWADYKFPKQIPLTTRLKDILEEQVAEKYYLPDERIEKILNLTVMQKTENKTKEEPIRLSGLYDTENRKHQIGSVYSKNGISPTLDTMQGGNRQPFIVEEEPFVVASRGRNPGNPSDRTTGVQTEQRLEPNFSGCTNTLTSVQKDNYICEPQVLRAERTEYGKSIRKQYEAGEVYEKIGNMRELKPRTDGVANTITTLLKDNYVVEPLIIEDFYQSRDPRVYQETAPTLRSERIGLKVAEDIKPELVGGIGEKNFGKQYRQGNRVYNSEKVAMALNSQPVGNTGGYSYLYAIKEDIKWRIRKLTTKECWRLMGFADIDHDSAAKYVSGSQLYRQAGNSIVTSCLVAIFHSLFIKDENDGYQKYLINFND